ncbi:MAG: RDD family protein [Gammaproteobacteria bacterium]|nr:MAG: RDD family protein [Gammaproteobacteria bacterium]RKZ41871.1 MAG: RDD family protein [Gammaproteobacteria bacterium]RKZ75186.1 MAG: RDD family protein [Gammaproteobacteria bacterium]
MLLDTTRSIETPEGIELALRVVGPVARAIAWAIDLGIRSILYLILLFFLAKLGKLGMGLLLMSIFILEWFYPVLFEVYRQGATPGKRAMKIKVLHELGTPVDWSASMIRNLLRAVDFLPFLYGFGFMTMLINKDFKRIGDLAAGTIVVYEDEKVKTLNLPDESPRAMPIALPLEEQQAIIKFAERAQKLPPGRAIELANIVTPMTGETGEAAIKNLYQLANSLIGVRH